MHVKGDGQIFNANDQRVTRLIELGNELSRFKDLDVLLERILSLGREIVSADAGSIYVKEGQALKCSYTQNATLEKRLPPGKKLIYSTFSIPINNETISGYVANSGTLLNIPDVYEIPADRPYGFGRKYDVAAGYRTKSVLTAPLETHMGVVGVLQLINAKTPEGAVVPFAAGDEPVVKHLAATAAVALERAQMTRALILRMIKMAELRDPKETGAHVNRVAAYAVEIYERWARMRDVPEIAIQKDKDLLRMAAMLHDVGKIAISDKILKKPGRLDDEERRIMKSHAWLGSRLFTDKYSEFDEAASIVALNHHEWWNGGGYPGHIDYETGLPLPGRARPDGSAQGRAGEEIHAFGRVVAIADVYDALLSRRAYKEAWTEADVLGELERESGGQFDPEMIEAFFGCLDVLRSIPERYPGQ